MDALETDDTDEEEETPVWQRLNLSHLGLLLALVGIGLMGFGFWSQTIPAELPLGLEPAGSQAEAVDAVPDEATANEEATPSEPAVVVYVVGAVRRPGVYRVTADARVSDAVQAAGGLRPNADSAAVNLAQRVQDEQQIVVPEAGAEQEAQGKTNTEAGLVDINTVGASELEALPRIGATLAARIIEDREANGPFDSVEDLRRVKGISESLFGEVAPLITAH